MNNDKGLDYRQKELKRRAGISKVLFKFPISEIYKNREKSKKFYGHIFGTDFDVTSLGNTQYLGSNFEKFINVPTKHDDDFCKKTDSKRNTKKATNQGNIHQFILKNFYL